jgi:hypothetical protein
MRRRAWVLLAGATVLAGDMGSLGCGTDCPSGHVLVCDDQGNGCECGRRCSEHADCDSGQYCLEGIDACGWVREGQTAAGACGAFGQPCCLMSNAFGSADACLEGNPCNSDFVCGQEGIMPSGIQCVDIDAPCTADADCCASYDGTGRCAGIDYGMGPVFACRHYCQEPLDCSSQCCFPVGNVGVCGPPPSFGSTGAGAGEACW